MADEHFDQGENVEQNTNEGEDMANEQQLPGEDQLVNAGIARDDISRLLRSHGQDVLGLIEKAIDNGVSAPVVMEILNTGGKVFLDLFASLKGKKVNFASAAAPQEGERVDEHQERTYQALQSQVIMTLVQRFLPMIIEKLATPDNLQKIMDLLLKGDSPDRGTPTPQVH